jgi:hypothetical protein
MSLSYRPTLITYRVYIYTYIYLDNFLFLSKEYNDKNVF